MKTTIRMIMFLFGAAIALNAQARECETRLRPGSILTIAGGGDLGDGGPALDAALGFPPGIAVDVEGNVYIGDETAHTVRKVDAQTGIITAVAGISNDAGYSGDGGLATEAEFNLPSGVAVDRDTGDLYVADRLNHVIRRVDAKTGIVETVAGNGIADYNGDGIPATEASLRLPVEVSLDRDGNILIADQYNFRVRKVDAATGIITTVAGTGIPGYNGDSIPATQARLNLPAKAVSDASGNIYIADKANHRIRRVDVATGQIRTIAGTGEQGFGGDGGPAGLALLNQPAGLAWDRGGNLYVTDESNNVVRRIERETLIISTVAGSGRFGFAGDGGPATAPDVEMILITGFATPGLGFSLDGSMFFADRGNQRIRKVDAAGTITTIAGGGDPGQGIAATEATFVVPAGAWIDKRGDMYVADRGNNVIRRISAGRDGRLTGASDEIVTNFAGTGVAGFSGDGGQALEAEIMLPMAVVGNNRGRIYFTDQFNNRIRAVNLRTGVIRTVAGTTGGGGYNGDGVPATEARLNVPFGIALDDRGNLFISDQFNNRIRRVDAGLDGIVNGGPNEIITTVVGDGEKGYSGDGLVATQSRVNRPAILEIDGRNNLYFADKDSNLIRVVTPGVDGIITGADDELLLDVVGTALTKGYDGDGGPAKQALLGLPTGVAVDGSGALYIGDFQNNVVRKVTPGADGVVTGGDGEIISTVAGIGDQPGFEGDCGPATQAKLDLPLSVEVDREGNIYIGDVPNSRIRKVVTPP